EGSTGNEIVWTANDLNPATYSLTNNTEEFDSGTWVDGQVFTISVDGLAYGIYTFNLTVADVDGNSVSDTVIVNVTDGTNPTTDDTTDDDNGKKRIPGYSLELIILCLNLVSLALIKRKKHK
ncbi:MAG: Loki-CTERM sorting domain-containing protein, partial [Promethearchaeota archaeon]